MRQEASGYARQETAYPQQGIEDWVAKAIAEQLSLPKPLNAFFNPHTFLIQTGMETGYDFVSLIDQLANTYGCTEQEAEILPQVIFTVGEVQEVAAQKAGVPYLHEERVQRRNIIFSGFQGEGLLITSPNNAFLPRAIALQEDYLFHGTYDVRKRMCRDGRAVVQPGITTEQKAIEYLNKTLGRQIQ